MVRKDGEGDRGKKNADANQGRGRCSEKGWGVKQFFINSVTREKVGRNPQ